MSLGKHDVVPIDTYVHTLAMKYYGLNTANYDDIASYFEQLWQPLSGWAQAVCISLRFMDSFLFLS